MKQKTVENKKKFGRDYPDIFNLKNLVKKQAYAIKSDVNEGREHSEDCGEQISAL